MPCALCYMNRARGNFEQSILFCKKRVRRDPFRRRRNIASCGASARRIANNPYPEVVGEQVKTAQWAVFTPRYPTKQGVEGAIYNCDAKEAECFFLRHMRLGRAMKNPTSATKKKSRASGFFFLYFSLFSFHSSLFSKCPARLFQRRDKREERKEKVAFLPLVEKH